MIKFESMKKVKSLFLCVLAFLTFTFVGSAYSHESKTEKVSIEKTTVVSDVEVTMNEAVYVIPVLEAQSIYLFTHISTIDSLVFKSFAATKLEKSDFRLRYRYGTDLTFSYNKTTAKRPNSKLHVSYLIEPIKLC
jgi:hypothetical protein